MCEVPFINASDSRHIHIIKIQATMSCYMDMVSGCGELGSGVL